MSQLVLPTPEQPYRGIEPFRFIDRDIFVGRESEVWDLLNLVTGYRGVLLYGASGLGKSSLINAGLVPAALAANFVPVRLRVQPRAGREFVASRFFEPGYEDFEGPDFRGEFDVDSFPERFGNKNTASGFPVRSLLIFDQFEELITLFEDYAHGGPPGKAQAIQTRIVDCLIGLLQDPQIPAKLLFVFREDFLAKLNILFERSPDLIDQKLRILPLRYEKVFDIIRAPFEKLPQTFKRELSPELARTIADDISKRDSAGSIDFTTLQIVCLSLWQSDDPEALFAQRGVTGLLEDSFSKQLYHLREDIRDAAVVLLGYMITTSNTRNIISGIDLVNRAESEHRISSEKLLDALRELSRTGLVRRELRNRDYFYELVSEFLIPTILHLTRERQVKTQLEFERRENEERVEEERRRAKRMLRFVVVLVLAGALLLGLTFYAISQRRVAQQISETARRQQAQAEIERVNATRITRILESLTSKDSNARLNAIGEIETLRSDNPKLASQLLEIAIRDSDPRVAARASALLTQPVVVPK